MEYFLKYRCEEVFIIYKPWNVSLNTNMNDVYNKLGIKRQKYKNNFEIKLNLEEVEKVFFKFFSYTEITKKKFFSLKL